MKKANSLLIALGMIVLGGLVFTGTAAPLSAAGQDGEDPQIQALLKKPAPLAPADQEDLARAIFKKMLPPPTTPSRNSSSATTSWSWTSAPTPTGRMNPTGG